MSRNSLYSLPARLAATCLTLLILASGLTACGQKGPLYFPEKTQQDSPTDTTQTSSEENEQV